MSDKPVIRLSDLAASEPTLQQAREAQLAHLPEGDADAEAKPSMFDFVAGVVRNVVLNAARGEELDRLLAEEAERREARKRGGLGSARVQHTTPAKWLIAWPAYVADRESRLAAEGDEAKKLEPARLEKDVLGAWNTLRGVLVPLRHEKPKPRSMEKWFKTWEAAFPKAEAQARQEVRRLLRDRDRLLRVVTR